MKDRRNKKASRQHFKNVSDWFFYLMGTSHKNSLLPYGSDSWIAWNRCHSPEAFIEVGVFSDEINKLHNKIQNDKTGQHLFELKKTA